jgi:FeS assembly protein IscX
MRRFVSDRELELYWESTYAIVVVLMESFPDLRPENVGLQELAGLVAKLPGFADDPHGATEQMLLDIQTVWYEEASTL